MARAQHRSAGRAAMRTPLLASARVIGASCWHVARGGHHTRLWPALAYLRRPAAARRVPMTTANKTPARQNKSKHCKIILIFIQYFSKKKLDLEDKKFKIENQGYEILKRSKKEKLEEEH